jgi:hypothetical protein
MFGNHAGRCLLRQRRWSARALRARGIEQRRSIMKEPYRTIYWTLASNNHPVGQWKYDVKISGKGAIYIGDDANHCTVLEGTDGYHHNEDGQSLNGQHEAYTTIDSILERANYNYYFYSDRIINALTWLKDNRVAW